MTAPLPTLRRERTNPRPKGKPVKKLRERIAAVAKRLDTIQFGIYRAYRRQKVKRERAVVCDKKAAWSSANADRARANGRPRKATRFDRRASKYRARAAKNRAQARWWIGRIKELKIKREGVEKVKRELDAELAKLEAKRIKIRVRDNKIEGGTPKERFRAACLLSAKRCANGKRPNFYSQPGTFTVSRCLTGESYGQRSDCSQWITSVCWTAGLDDPNGANWSGGYTGTMVGGHGKWRECGRGDLLEKGWGYVVYGTGTGFHTEAYVGPGTRTIGHGDAAINAGDLDMFGDRRYFVYG